MERDTVSILRNVKRLGDAEEISLGNEERFWQERRSSSDYKVLATRQCRFFFLLPFLFFLFFSSFFSFSLPSPRFSAAFVKPVAEL